MPKIPPVALLLTLAAGCSFDLVGKTACESQSDCLDGRICVANRCTAEAEGDPAKGGTPGSSTAGVASSVGGASSDRSGAGADGVQEGGSSGGETPEPEPPVVGGAGGAPDVVQGGVGGASPEPVGGAGGEAAGGAAGCEEPTETAEVAYLLHPYPATTAVRFGKALAIDGDTLVVGTPRDEAAFVYVKTECGWSFQAELNADDETLGSNFGNAVAIQGDTIVVGASLAEITPSEGEESIKAGAAYVFERGDGTWSQGAKLQAHNADATDLFGACVALDAGTIAIGAPGEDSASRTINAGSDDDSLESDGAAYLFSRVGDEWGEAAYLKREGDNPSGDVNWGFGVSVGLSNQHLVVGSPGSDFGGITDVGAAYAFNEESGVWAFEQALWVRAQLTSDNHGSKFGSALAVSEDFLAVGAPDDGDGATPYGTVSIYSYQGKNQGWVLNQRLGGFERSSDFGASLAMGPGRLIVGDSVESNGAQGIDAPQGQSVLPAVGAAHLFDRNPFTYQWRHTHYIKASNALAYDQFGDSVAISGDAFVVSAPQRHSAPESLYSPMDKYRLGPGATYVYRSFPK